MDTWFSFLKTLVELGGWVFAIVLFWSGCVMLKVTYKMTIKPGLVGVLQRLVGTAEQIKDASAPINRDYKGLQAAGGALSLDGKWMPQTTLSQQAIREMMDE